MTWRQQQRSTFNQGELIAEWVSYEKNNRGHNRNFSAPDHRGNQLSLGNYDHGLAVCFSLSVCECAAARWSAGRDPADAESGCHPGGWSAGGYGGQRRGDAIPEPITDPRGLGSDPFQTAILLCSSLECINDWRVAGAFRRASDESD